MIAIISIDYPYKLILITLHKGSKMATLKSYGDQLADVQEAIASVLTSQRYEINGRSVQRAELEWLHKREDYLSDKVSRYGATAIVGAIRTSAVLKVSFENEF